MKPSNKLKAMGRAAVLEAVRTAPTLAAAAAGLGVDYSTLFRWAKADPVIAAAVKERARRRAGVTVARFTSPEAWARAVRRAYTLSVTELAILDLAVRALTAARDPKVSTATQMTATGRFQQLVKQLNLETEDNVGEAEETPPVANVRTWPRRA